MKVHMAALAGVLAICLTGFAQADYADYVLSTNPTIYWQFEETAFANYSATNVAVDAAVLGGSNNGIGASITEDGETGLLGPETGGAGVAGNAAVFTKGVDKWLGGQGIEFSGLNTIAGVTPNDYSIQLWVKSDREVINSEYQKAMLHYFFGRSQDSSPTISGAGAERPDTLSYNAYSADRGSVLRYVSLDGGTASADDDADPNTTPTDMSGTTGAGAMGWHHIVMTRSSVDDVAVYLDGALEISISGDTLDPSYIGDCLLVGNRPDYLINGYHGFTGLIDEVAVWNNVLTPGQVASLYSELPEVPPTADAKFDGPWPKIFDYTVGPAHYGTTAHDCSVGIDPNGFYDQATEPLRNRITPVPRPGAYLAWDHERITTCYDRVLQEGRPLTINLNSYTFPLGNNPSAENRDPQALSKTMDYLSSLPAQDGVPNSEGRLDYVLMDLEPSWQATANANVAEAVNQVRAHANPRINQAKVGNYNYFPCSELPWLPYAYQDSSSRQEMVNGAYESTGVNVAMPSLYPYEYYELHTSSRAWGYDLAPNKRSALFWAPLTKLSEAKKCLPEGHELIPYMNNMVQYTDDSYHADPPTKEDCAALLQHTRLRGADGYYIWRTYAFEMEDGTPYEYDNDEYRGDMLEAWTSLDWLYGEESQSQILNLETDKQSGLQWSAALTDQGVAVLVSNLGNSSVWFDMPDVGEYADYLVDGFEIAAGTHRMEVYQIPTNIPGDANGDGKVDGSDVTILAGNWQAGVSDPNTSTITWAMGDFNGDGQVDGSDVTILAGNWQYGVIAAAAAVPEPSTLMMLLALAGGFLAWHRR